MNARIALTAILIALPGLALGQGFAGLGTAADGFTTPRPGVALEFPEDHGPHPDYRIEWWYLTANLTGEDGRDYGIQWTLFRTALTPQEAEGWQSPQLWLGNAAVTTPERHFTAQRFARGGIGQAGVTARPFAAWIDEWRMAGPTPDAITLTAQGDGFGYELQAVAEGPLVAQGDAGYSVKSAEGQASYYYSQPFYRLSGTLTLPEGEVAVTGSGWMDREWSSQPLSENQTGWDWFSLHLDGGAKLMGFRLRQTDGSDYTSATWIAPDGTPTPLPDGAFQADPLATATVAGREVPVRWRVRLDAQELDVTVDALNPQSWMDTVFPYWEGPVSVSGTHGGRGYLEMTGYE